METKNESSSYVYTMPCKPGSVFVNFGQDCLNDCRFCVKRFGNFFGYSLNVEYSSETLGHIENGLERIAILCENPKEIAICGTGEPFLHYDIVIKVSKTARKIFDRRVPIRADTTGLWWKQRRDLSFLEHIDSLSISLNAESEDKYNAMCQPKIPNAYGILMDFLKTLSEEKKRKEKFPDVRLTIVDTSAKEFMPSRKETDYEGDCPVPDISKCRDIANIFGFPLVVKHLFRDVNELCWNPNEIEEKILKGISLERCIDCKYRHI
jgi:TatD family-associated radical SAM protein